VCATGQTCAAGSCKLQDGRSCGTGSECASGTCTTFYVDADGETYGDPNPVNAIHLCGGPQAPTGYSANNKDCCDNGGDVVTAKLIHPGADFQFTAATTCGINWDYNCDGAVDGNLRDLVYCDANCSAVTQPFPASQCGMSTVQASCMKRVSDGSCNEAAIPGTLGCR